MILILDKAGTILASAATADDVKWFDGYGLAPGGVSILGPRDAFDEVEVDIPETEGALQGRRWSDNALVALPVPEAPPEPGAVPAPPYELYKTDVISRMTDEELDSFDTQLRAASTRERRMWTDCTRLVSTDPYFDALKAGFAHAFGVPRAEALLRM